MIQHRELFKSLVCQIVLRGQVLPGVITKNGDGSSVPVHVGCEPAPSLAKPEEPRRTN